MKDIFTSAWFWLAAFAYVGANFGVYLASKDYVYKTLGRLAKLIKLAIYVFVVLLFWKLDQWYYPLIVFAAFFLFDQLFVLLHGQTHVLLRSKVTASELRIFGVVGTLGGIVLVVLAYIALFNA